MTFDFTDLKENEPRLLTSEAFEQIKRANERFEAKKRGGFSKDLPLAEVAKLAVEIRKPILGRFANIF